MKGESGEYRDNKERIRELLITVGLPAEALMIE